MVALVKITLTWAPKLEKPYIEELVKEVQNDDGDWVEVDVGT